MNEDYKKLKNKFLKIKKMGLIKSLRNGPTGLGYTFESLLGKIEDQESKPDFGKIELKCLLGYSKSSISLFHCVGERDNKSASDYLFSKYSYHRYGNANDYRLFSRNVYANDYYQLYDWSFVLKIDYESQKLFMQSFKNGVFVENVCYWNLSDLKYRLNQKFTFLALIEGYPYRKNKTIYYKYFKLALYKLKGFDDFLKLIELNKIYVSVYERETINKYGDIRLQSSMMFKLDRSYIDGLFVRIK